MKAINEKTFCKFIREIIQEEERDKKFEAALRASAKENSVFYFSDRQRRLVGLLSEIVGDIDDFCAWWLWDAPDRGRGSIENCTVTWKGKTWVLKKAKDLYRFLKEYYKEEK